MNLKHIDRWDRRTIEIALSQVNAARSELEQVLTNIDREMGRLQAENDQLRRSNEHLILDD